jgi:hypothetical protein
MTKQKKPKQNKPKKKPKKNQKKLAAEVDRH